MNPEERTAQEREILPFLDPLPHSMIDVGVGPGTEAQTMFNHVMKEDDARELNIIGLEPHPDRFAEIKYDFPGTALPLGVWNYACHKTLWWGPANEVAKPAPSVYRDTGAEYRHSVSIACMTIDMLIRYYELDGPILLWADIEGAELEMLRGAQCALNSGIRYINLEVRDEPRTRSAASFDEIKAYLSHFGFEVVHEYGWSDDIFRDVLWVKN